MLDDFREWLSDNLRYILLGLAVVLILVIGFCVFRLISGSSGGKADGSGMTESEVSSETVTEAQTQAPQSQGETQAATAAAGTDSLVKDDAAILTLVREYYTAAAEKDVTTLESIVSPWNDEVEASVLRNDAIESYENISTYSKAGPVEGSYVVYAYYEGKIANIDTLVPSLSMLYLTTNEEGNLIVSDRSSSKEVSDYIDQVSLDDDVQALVADVSDKCKAAEDSDPALKEFMESLDGTGETDTSGEESGSGSGEVSGEMTVDTEMLNVRQEPSTDSAIMGIIASGSTVTVLEDAGDGWCKISYDAGSYTIEGYVRTEYLTSSGTSGDASEDGGTAETTEETQDSEGSSIQGTASDAQI